MESADISIPLFDAQQWKVLTSAYHCLTQNNGNVNHSPYRHVNQSQSLFLRAPHQERSEPLCGECPYILG